MERRDGGKERTNRHDGMREKGKAEEYGERK